MQKKSAFLSLFLAGSVIIFMALWYPKWEKTGTEATLSWDVLGYYLYLPACFIYKDLKQLDFKKEIISKYQPTSGFYQAFRHQKSGNYIMKYPVGLAVLYAPFFGIAHGYALMTAYPADGFSFPYQFAISWGSVFIAFLGLWFSLKILRLYFNDLSSGATLLLVAIGSNYLNYSAIDGAMPHNWIFTLYAMLIWLTIQWYEKPSLFKSLAIGLCVGLAALSRPTAIIACLIPLIWGLSKKADIITRFSLFTRHWKLVISTIFTVALVGSIQLLYWKSISGEWIIYSYEEQGFSWLRPHIKDVLISYRKGWLVYTPIMLLTLFGFIPLYKKYKPVFWVSFFYFLLHFYIVAAWDIWAYGGAFGQRALIESYAVLIFPLAAFWEKAFQYKRLKWLSIGFSAFCIWLNIFQTYQAHGYGFETEAMTKAYFWRIFANPNPTDLDKKLLDSKEDYQGERIDVQQVYFNDFEDKPKLETLSDQYAFSGNYALRLNKEKEFSSEFLLNMEEKHPKWIRAGATFFLPQKEWSVWNMTQMIVQIEKDGYIVKKRMIRIQRQLSERQWQANWIDLQLPQEGFDQVKIYFWNAGSAKEVFVDDLKVEVYQPE